MVFLYNLVWSYFKGKPAGGNPWSATTLEWQTPRHAARHGNWGKELPVVYRWAYDYGVPGLKTDFIPQNVPPAESRPKPGSRPRSRQERSAMTIGLVFLSVLMAVIVWWLFRQTINVQPWQAQVAVAARGRRRADPAGGQDGLVGVPRRRHLAVRAVRQRLCHAPGPGGLDARCPGPGC